MRRAVAGVMAVLLLAGCAEGFNDPEDRADQVTDPVPAVEQPDPDPISFDVGDCLRVDKSGVSPRFQAQADCDELHEAQVYMARTVQPDYGLGAIALECAESLRSRWRDAAEGRAYAVTAPINYVHNQAATAYGDEVLCVYMFTMPRNGAVTLTDKPERVEPTQAPEVEDADED